MALDNYCCQEKNTKKLALCFKRSQSISEWTVNGPYFSILVSSYAQELSKWKK